MRPRADRGRPARDQPRLDCLAQQRLPQRFEILGKIVTTSSRMNRTRCFHRVQDPAGHRVGRSRRSRRSPTPASRSRDERHENLARPSRGYGSSNSPAAECRTSVTVPTGRRAAAPPALRVRGRRTRPGRRSAPGPSVSITNKSPRSASALSRSVTPPDGPAAARNVARPSRDRCRFGLRPGALPCRTS